MRIQMPEVGFFYVFCRDCDMNNFEHMAEASRARDELENY